MTGWFEWNGEKSTDYGIIVSQHPPLTIPSERSTQTNVPGRPGSLTTLEGEDVYDDMILSADCFIQDISRISEIAAWLKGSGKVTFIKHRVRVTAAVIFGIYNLPFNY